ncbi:MAG: glycyl-radical enzyme activating protein [Lentisphaeria bacterium]|nr:glycyl-radical enzyme activating protein [Lentisphaeria bacterium]
MAGHDNQPDNLGRIMMESGLVFDLARFSLHDGPGIRTVVFLKGCPLRCVWCHNPESQQSRPELLFSPEKCISCGECVNVCPRHVHICTQEGHRLLRDSCAGCGKCAGGCFSGALELSGQIRTVDDILNTAALDQDYYGTAGGLTLSGGEPLFQPDFTEALLKGAKARHWTTAIETCGMANPEILTRMFPWTDHWLYDIKVADPEKHLRFTGMTNDRILNNLRLLDDAGASIELRCPLIPGWNDSDSDLQAIRDLADSLKSFPAIHIEPFHPFGRGKLERLGLPGRENARIPDDKDMKRWADFLLK